VLAADAYEVEWAEPPLSPRRKFGLLLDLIDGFAGARPYYVPNRKITATIRRKHDGLVIGCLESNGLDGLRDRLASELSTLSPSEFCRVWYLDDPDASD
jgi:hypothetical protein